MRPYPDPQSAAEHVVTRIPVARAGDRVVAVIGGLAGREFDSLDAVYVLDDAGHLVGTVPLARLFGAEGDRELGTLLDARTARVGPRHDQEHVAAEALSQGATSVAVVDDDGRLMGVVPAGSLLEILHHEHAEDLHRIAGIQHEDFQAHAALEAPPARRARHRLPWLLVGLVGSMGAAMLMSRFERILERELAVAFFVPSIVYLADAIGTQTEAIAVRGLSLSRLPLRDLLGGELRTGLLIGGTLAAISLAFITLVFGDLRLGGAVALAILASGGLATSTGLIFPWLLQRLGSDPAYGSGPVATIIQDVLSIAIYFAIVSLVL